MAIPLVQLLDDPSDNESKLWNMIKGVKSSIEGKGGALAGWGDSSGPNGDGNAITGAGSGPIGVNAPEDAAIVSQEITETSVLATGTVAARSWSYVGPNKETYVYTEEGTQGKVYRIVGATITEVPIVPAVGELIGYPGYSDEPSYVIGGAAGALGYCSIRKNKRASCTPVGDPGAATVRRWTKIDNRLYAFQQIHNGRETFHVYDSDVGGTTLSFQTVLDGVANGVKSCQATKNFLWVLDNSGKIFKLDRTSFALLETIDLGSTPFAPTAFLVVNEKVIYFIRAIDSTHASLSYLKDGQTYVVDSSIVTTLNFAALDEGFMGMAQGDIFIGLRTDPNLYHYGVLNAPGESAASEILLLGENGQITADSGRIATLDTINRRVGINTGAPQETLDVRSDREDVPMLGLHSSGTGILVDLFVKSSSIANLRIRGEITTSPATRWVFLTNDSGDVLRERLFIDNSIGVGTGSPNYGGFGRTVTIESTTDTALELVSTRPDADDVLIGAVSANYRANIATQQRIADVQFKSSGATAQQRGGMIQLHTKANASAALTERFRVGPVGQWGIGGATFGAANNIFKSGGVSAQPSWGTVNLLDSDSHGDTLTGTVVRGDLIVGNITPKWSRFAVGANNTLLKSNGTDPSWLDYTTDWLSQYVLLAGRSGGQTVIGGTAAGDRLILRATSGVGIGSEAIIFQLGNNGANEVFRATRANSQGQLGINVTVPLSPLHIKNTSDAVNAFTLQGDAANANLKFDRYSADTSGAVFIGRKARGTLASPAQSLSGDLPMIFASYGSNATGGEVASLATFRSILTEDTTATAGGSAWEVLVVANGGLVQKRSVLFDQDASIQHHVDSVFKMAAQNRFRHQENCVAVYRTTNQSINNSTFTAISFDAEDFDTDGMHEAVTNPTRITISLTGKYFVTATAYWDGNATGLRFLVIRKNGVATDLITAGMAGNASGLPHNVNGLLSLVSGDYIEALVWQNSGGALNLTAAGTSLNFHANYIGE